jgi:hypothetical protein
MCENFLLGAIFVVIRFSASAREPTTDSDAAAREPIKFSLKKK